MSAKEQNGATYGKVSGNNPEKRKWQEQSP